MKNRTLARFPLTVLAALLPLTSVAAFAAGTTPAAPAAQNQRTQGNQTQQARPTQNQNNQTQQPGMRGGPQGQARDGQRGGGPRAVIDTAVAKALGLTPETLRQQLKAGKTIADLAKAGGVSTATLRAAALAALKTQLAAEVKAGKLTQAQADQRLARATADANFGLMAGGPRGGPDGGPNGGRGGPDGGRNGGPADNNRNNNDRPAGPRGDLPTDGA
ncbi:hypothetical protein [Deinococcus puniceus]|uniref:hypothetical protein n=1 Tax=Deinococcus puniceus TaxID=1182568 RepID=UPI0007C964D8|nr:hypothetical protein [Deinococcus puniceus]